MDRGKSYCSSPCHPDRRSPLRRAAEEGNWPAVIDILLERTDRDGGCRIWSGQAKRSNKGGGSYGRVSLAGKQWQTHRLMALAVRGGEDIGHMPVHHICANSLCIEPSHLQVVTPEENTAEMLERSHYLARIHSLEQALAAVAPSHPLLRQ